MDEIDELKFIKKRILVNFFVFTIIHFLFWFLIMPLVSGFADFKDFGLEYVLTAFIIYFILTVFFSLPLCIAYIIKKKRYSNKKVFEKTSINNIIREMPEKYAPAICSFLYNNKVETYTDYTATVLNLEQKGYIKINCKDNEYFLEFINNNLEKLNLHEKYVLDCLKGNEKANVSNFEHCVTKDMYDLDLIKISKKRINSEKRSEIKIAAFFIFFGIIYYLIEKVHLKKTDIYILIIAIIGIIGCIIFEFIEKNKNYKTRLTKKGKKIKKQVIGLKSFLVEYTLMKDRSINYKELFGNYVAYAISLGETDKINEFIEKNDKYRNFIYRV